MSQQQAPDLPHGLSSYLLMKEMTKLLRSDRKTIGAMVKRGELPAPIRIGNRLLFNRGKVQEYLDRQQAEAEARCEKVS